MPNKPRPAVPPPLGDGRSGIVRPAQRAGLTLNGALTVSRPSPTVRSFLVARRLSAALSGSDRKTNREGRSGRNRARAACGGAVAAIPVAGLGHLLVSGKS